MKNSFLIVLSATALLFACTKDNGETGNNNNNSTDNGSGWNTTFPQKKIQQIQFNFNNNVCTFDFSWIGDRLDKIAFINPNGLAINHIYFYYDNKGRIAKTAHQMNADDEIYDAFVYTYDANNRLEKQEVQVPYTIDEVLVYKPTTYTFTYANGHISKIHRKHVYIDNYPDETTEENDYECTWTGDNMTSFKDKDRHLTFNIQYDDKNNPLRFPMGIETLDPMWGNHDDEQVVQGDFSYISSLFWLSFGKNNATSMTINGQTAKSITYTYDSDGYPHSATLIFGDGTQWEYTFVY